ncbi:MAG: TlpA disulfide reductase family protein [Bacteroidota bacterium]|nr:TlpA disulfide reductase family protein [Bacteroidota bacterium]
MRRAWVVLALIICARCHQADSQTGAARALADASERVPAPDFHLPTLAGDSLTLSSLRGRVVVLNFWATWCKPCLKEMPALEELHRTMASQGVSIVGVSVDTADPSFISHFVERLSVSYPVIVANHSLTDAYSQLPARLSLRIGSLRIHPTVPIISALDALPTTILVDPQGRIAASLLGLLHIEDLKAMVNHLRESQPAQLRVTSWQPAQPHWRVPLRRGRVVSPPPACRRFRPASS